MESMLYRKHRFLGGTKYFDWAWVCGRRTSFCKTLHVKNGRKCDQSEGCHEVWSTFDSQNDPYCVQFESSNRPRHFDRGIVHAENLAKLFPKNLTKKTKGKPKECLPGPSWMHRKWRKFLKHVIKDDELWIFEYFPETKRQISEWHKSNSPRP